jgi:hypothetical protein
MLPVQVLVKKEEDADEVFGLSTAKRGAKKGKKGAAGRMADKPVRLSFCTHHIPPATGCVPPSAAIPCSVIAALKDDACCGCQSQHACSRPG